MTNQLLIALMSVLGVRLPVITAKSGTDSGLFKDAIWLFRVIVFDY